MSKKSDSDDKTVQLKAVPPSAPPKDTPVPTVVAVPQAAVVRPVVDIVKPAAAMSDAPGPVKKPEFIDRVVAASGVKKSDAKSTIEAALAVIGEALKNGEDLQLSPLGKIKVQNAKDVGQGATAYTLKVRTPKQD